MWLKWKPKYLVYPANSGVFNEETDKQNKVLPTGRWCQWADLTSSRDRVKFVTQFAVQRFWSIYVIALV